MPAPTIPAANSPRHPARYIMIGGFLGAGKTTAVAALAKQLTGDGLRVGLITNDQGSELVDTAMLRAQGFATEEIPGGCFCCRFNSLLEAADRLNDSMRPDVFIAEPVGSCTDLVATVTYPLRRIYGEHFRVAPLSVLVDPLRAERILGLTGGPQFSSKVRYIYRKQLEEADLIVITKSDLLDPDRLAVLQNRLALEFPHAGVLKVSVRDRREVESWFAHLTSDEQVARATIEVDYDLYAEGEALLGWLNATVQLTSSNSFDGDALLQTLAGRIQRGLGESEIAHLKMTLSPDEGMNGLAVVNLVRSDFIPELSLQLQTPIRGGQLIINCRAEAAPELLRAVVSEAVATLNVDNVGVSAQLEHLESFRPGKPQPTHRDLIPAGRA